METAVRIDHTEWEAVLTRVVPFAGGDELTGVGHVRLQADGQHRRWMATDSFRLAVLEAGEGPEVLEVSMPVRLVGAAVALTAGHGPAELTVERAGEGGAPHAVTLRVGEASMRLPAGPEGFPDVATLTGSLLDRPYLDMRVSRGLLLDLVRLGRLMPAGASIDGEGDDPGPLFWLHITPTRLELVVDWGDYGLSRFGLACRADGETSLPVNPLFLEEFLDAVDDDEIVVSLPVDRRCPLRFASDGWAGYLVPIDATPEQHRERLEGLLERMGVQHLVRDPDGDYPFRFGSADLYVRLPDDEPARVQVFSVVLRDVPCTEELLREVNDYNANLPFVRAFWFDEQVIVEIEQLASTLDVEELANGCAAVVTAAQDLGPVLSEFFGGTIAFDDGGA
ncbi:MAG: YbjN domain-containing protein [Acidimicrobiales bacterium]|nr:YbjN domain-containing protein [Acidimicrobiales bacterium]